MGKRSLQWALGMSTTLEGPSRSTTGERRGDLGNQAVLSQQCTGVWRPRGGVCAERVGSVSTGSLVFISPGGNLACG